MGSLILVVVIIVVVIVVKYLLEKKSGDAAAADFGAYAKKNRLMNDSELAFFVNLRQTLGERFLIFPKVRIEDFVEVKKGATDSKAAYGLRGRIKSRHIDFLVCDRAKTAPLLAIEVDGKSHERAERKDRDDFVEKLYESVGPLFYSVKVGSDFRAEVGHVLQRLESLEMVGKSAE